MKLTRRGFIKASLASSVVFVSAGLQSCASNNDDDTPPVTASFLHGVASGDPLIDSILLWTRVTPDTPTVEPIEIIWEVASDANFDNLVNMDSGNTDVSRDYTLKVDVRGLTPGTRYYYRFTIGNTVSPVGKTQTLPSDNLDQVKIAVFSCSNYPTGYFNVYREATYEANLNAVLHLGDYIYEHQPGGYAREQAEALGRQVEPDGECITLDDYRTRYAQYRTDENLQTLHAAFPWIVVWDDHEIANDAWREGAQNHDDTEGSYDARKQASLQAYFEWLPLRPITADEDGRIYREFAYGDLVNLMMLDTRRIGRDEQLSYANYISEQGEFDASAFTTDVNSADRTLLGETQRNWLLQTMNTSTARWQVLGQQVLMGRMLLPAVTLNSLNPAVTLNEYTAVVRAASKYQTILQELARQGVTDPTTEQLLAAGMTEAELAIVNDPNQLAWLESPFFPYNLDAWDGYAYDREVVLGAALAGRKNLISLAGDTHNAWSSQLTDVSGTAVGTEFATSSVSSPGSETSLGLTTREAAKISEAGLVQLINDLQYCNLRERGYMTVTFTQERAIARWIFVDTVLEQDYSVLTDAGKSLEVQAS
ncbi:MAG: alkaline phosphatase D family protein [Deinococcota bacterium]